MTVSAVTPRVVYEGTGAGPSTFAVSSDGQPILFYDNAEISVAYLDADGVITPLTEGLHYTLEGGPGAGIVTRTAGALPDDTFLAIWRNTPLSQDTDLIFNGDFSSETVELALDYRTRVEQDAFERLSRALVADVFDLAYAAGGRRISGLAAGVDDQDAVTMAQLAAAALGDVEFGADAITIAPIAGIPGADTVQDALEALSSGESVAAWTIYVRNAGTAGAPAAVAKAGFTEDLSPGTGDKLLGFLSSGEIRLFDVNNLPGGGGGGGLSNVVDDASPQLGGDLDTNGFDLIVKNGDVIRSGNTAANVLAIGAWDVDGATFVSMFDITSANTPTGNLNTAVTIGGAAIYRVGGTDVAIADGGTGASTASAAFTALKQAATTTATGVVEKAVIAEFFAFTDDKYIDCGLIEDAAAFVTLTDAATIALDWKTGVNFQVTVTANRALGNPTNGVPGTSRTVLVKGNDATDRTLTFGNQYGGTLPVLGDIDNVNWYLLTLFCVTTSHYLVASIDGSAP